MSVTQLIPWNHNHHGLVRSDSHDPFFALQREVNRLFDDMWSDFDAPLATGSAMMGTGWPNFDLVEQDKAFLLKAEVPGLDEKDIDIRCVDNTLILRGERKHENAGKDGDYRYSERQYGRFERRIPLSVEVEAEKASAVLRNGILTITLPKAAQATNPGFRIPVSKAA